MKKTNIINLTGFAIIIMIAGIATSALAEQRGNVLIATTSANNEQNTDAKENVDNEEYNKNRILVDEDKDMSTSSKNKDDKKSNNNASSSLSSELHRSTVSKFVENLLGIADREEGIGEDVRVIAREQNDSSTVIVGAMESIEKRGFIKTLSFGDDYKNLGIIRSELANTTNQIDRLKALASRTTNSTDKTELFNQINILENNQVELNKFIKDHEDSFSFFGWFLKMFSN